MRERRRRWRTPTRSSAGGGRQVTPANLAGLRLPEPVAGPVPVRVPVTPPTAQQLHHRRQRPARAAAGSRALPLPGDEGGRVAGEARAHRLQPQPVPVPVTPPTAQQLQHRRQRPARAAAGSQALALLGDEGGRVSGDARAHAFQLQRSQQQQREHLHHPASRQVAGPGRRSSRTGSRCCEACARQLKNMRGIGERWSRAEASPPTSSR